MAFSLGAISGSIALDISAFSGPLSQARSGLSSFASFAVSQGNAISSTLGGTMTRLGDAMAATHSRLIPFHQAWTMLSGAFQSVTGTIGNVVSGITGLGGRIVSLGASIGQNIFFWKQLIGAGVDFVTNLFSQNAAMEQTRIAFVGLLGSGQKADAMLRQLQQFAASTPFEFPELAHDSQLLIGMGFSAQSVIPTMTAVGDAVAGVGAGASGVQTVVTVLGQMHAAGKLNAGDMMQLTSLGIPAWKMLADAMGLSTQQVMSMTTRGLIPADKAIGILTTSMEKMYGGQMANQAQTFNGLISTLHDNLNMAFQAFLGPAFNAAKGGLLQLTNLMSSPAIMQFATNMGTVVGGAIANVSRFLAPAIADVGRLTASFFASGGAAQQLGAFLATNLLAPLGRLMSAIGPVVSDFAQWMVQSGTLQATLTVLGASIAGLVIGLGALISGLAATIKWFHDGSPAAQILGAALIGIGVAIGAIQIGAFIATIPALVAGFIAWAGAAGTAAVATIAATLPILAIGAAITLVVAGIILAVRNWGAISTWLIQTWGNVGAFFTGLFATIGGLFNTGVATIRSVFINGLTAMLATSQSVLGGMGAIFTSVLNGIVGIVTSSLTSIRTFFANTWQSIDVATGGTLSSMMNYIAGVLQTLVNIFVAIEGRILASWVSAFQQVGAFTSSIWASITSTISGAATSIYNTLASWTSKAASWVSTQWQNVSNTTSSAWASVSSSTSNWWGQVSNTIAQRTQQSSTFISNAWQASNASTTQWWSSIFGTVGNFLGQILQRVQSVGANITTSFLGAWKTVAGGIGGIVRGMANNAISVLNGMLGGLQSFLNAFGSGLNAVAKAVGASGVVPSISIGRVALLARGTPNFAGGPAIVGEQGPELVTLPKGASVLPTRETMAVLQSGMLKGIPGFASGTGNAFSDLLGFLGQGISAVGNLASGALNITADVASSLLHHYFGDTLKFPGSFADIAGAISRMVLKWGVSMVEKLLSTIQVAAPQFFPTSFNMGQFLLPGINQGFGGVGGHQGIDFAFSQGSPLHEVIGGRVTREGFYPWGGEIDVAIGSGLEERYIHLSKLIAAIGQVVRRGDLIGLTGGGTPQSGLGPYSTGAHLHYQIDYGSYTGAVNPLSVWASLGLFNPFSNAPPTAVVHPLPGGNFPGSLAGWIAQAIGLTGAPVSWMNALETIAMHESGGNPNNVNTYDINARRGTPSIGLMQTIQPTFNAYAVPGHGNIYNPVDNAAAAIRYIESRYGSVFNVPGIIALSQGRPYVGYANGGLIAEQISGVGLATGTRYSFGERGPETVIPGRVSPSAQPQVINLIVNGRELARALGSHLQQEIRLVAAKGGV